MSVPSSSRASSVYSFSMYDESRRVSFNVAQWNRLKELYSSVASCEKQLEENKEFLEDSGRMKSALECYNLSAQVQTLTIRNELRQQEVEKLRSMCSRKRIRIDELMTELEKKKESFNLMHKRNVILEERSDDFQKEYDARKKRLFVFTKLIRARRKFLLEELYSIFNIELDLTALSGKGACGCPKLDCITGIHLPPSLNLKGHQEIHYSAALGFVVHMLRCISSVMDYSWRYPVRACGSTSKIYNVKDNLMLPLHGAYRWKAERIRLDNAMTLLGKNIAQLRSDCGLHSPQLERILFTLDQWFLFVIKGAPEDAMCFHRPWTDFNSPALVIDMEFVFLTNGSHFLLREPIDDFGLKVQSPCRELDVEEATEESVRSSYDNSLTSNELNTSIQSCISVFSPEHSSECLVNGRDESSSS